jgi:cytochrome P450
MQPVQDPIVPEFAARLQQVGDYAEINEVMSSPDFVQGGAPVRRVFLDDTLMFAEGHRHFELKRMFQDLVSREAMAYYEKHLLGPKIGEVMADLMATADASGMVCADLIPFTQTVLHKISAGVTGVDGVDTPERCMRFKNLVTALGKGIAAQFATGDIPVIVEQAKRDLQSLVDEFLQASLDRRVVLAKALKENKVAKGDLPRDALMMLCIQDDLSRPDDHVRVPYIWRQAAIFLSAAVQTTTHTFPHVVVHIDEWCQQHPADRARLLDAEFLHACVAEALRLHQTAPVRLRIAARDTVLSTGRKVAGGEMLSLRASHANMDPAIFGENPRLFNPYRPRPKAAQPWGMTFGAGRHMCIGRNLVMGLWGKGDKEHGTEGEMVSILRALYERGCILDPKQPIVRNRESYHDTFENVPILLQAG